MSNVKFRAWIKAEKRFIFNKPPVSELSNYWGYRKGEYILQQFIDIIDKNGNKIFESDKLKFGNWIIEVEKHLGAFGYWVDKDKEWGVFIPFSGHNQIEYFGNQTNDLEVVGHIHE